MGEFNSQNLANVAWAFAMASDLDVPLCLALAEEAERRVDELLGDRGGLVEQKRRERRDVLFFPE